MAGHPIPDLYQNPFSNRHLCTKQRIYRMPGFLFSRPNMSPHPLTPKEVSFLPTGSPRGETHSLAGGTQFRRRDILVLYVYNNPSTVPSIHIHNPDHRVYTDWRLPTSGVQPTMMEKSVLAGKW
jgi:hypothetical protein